jgi:hypothetical protein
LEIDDKAGESRIEGGIKYDTTEALGFVLLFCLLRPLSGVRDGLSSLFGRMSIPELEAVSKQPPLNHFVTTATWPT